MCAHFKSHKLKQIHFGQNVSQQRPFDSSYGRMSERVNIHVGEGRRKCMSGTRVGITRQTVDQFCFVFFFELKDVRQYSE